MLEWRQLRVFAASQIRVTRLSISQFRQHTRVLLHSTLIMLLLDDVKSLLRSMLLSLRWLMLRAFRLLLLIAKYQLTVCPVESLL